MTDNQTQLRCMGELESLLANMPSAQDIVSTTDEAVSWNVNLEKTLNEAGSRSLAGFWSEIIDTARNPILRDEQKRRSNIQLWHSDFRSAIHRAVEELKYDCRDHGSVVVAAGASFDYFDEIRQRMQHATSDIFFVDPYLDADFIKHYMPFVGQSVTARLLTSGKQASKEAAAAASAFVAQEGISIEVKQSNNTLHDRWLIVDQSKCYQSGASFKDGAVRSNTTITESIDLAPAMIAHYESEWQQATLL